MKRLLTILLIASAICSCRTIQVVPEIHCEYIHDTISLVDSVWRDRVHTEYKHGDTIILRDSVYLYQYKTIDKVVEVYRTDSIPYEVEVPVVQKVVPPFYRWSTGVCWAIIICIILYGSWRVVKAIYLRR